MIKYEVEVSTDGDKCWYLDGKRHREGGPAVECADGDKWWYLNDKFHREDGPAVEYANGNKFWYLNDRLYREDGPAIEYADGGKRWFLNDEELTEAEHKAKTNPTVEMTMEEICKALGKNVKVKQNDHI
jgi:hypothetical protein